MTATLVTGQGEQVGLAAKLGSGGEGAVYALTSHPQAVAKIYHHVPDSQKQAKLGAMVRGCDDDLQKIAAWPTETLEKDGAVIGFVMPLLRDCQPVHHLYNPGQRKQFFPQADYAFLVHTARNIAAAFATIHRHGHAVGDVNQGNLVVKADGTVSFIDCDSFQIQVEHKHFLCEVGVAHFTAPELQGKAFAQIVTTPDHDNFGLAVLIFHLLMMGRHPFAGVYSGEGDMPIEQAIKEFRYAYSLRSVGKKMSPPPNSISPDILSQDIAALFERAFYAPNRPTAQEWLATLGDFEKKLTSCAKVALHKYPATMMGCPWCYYATHKKVLFFSQGQYIAPPITRTALPDDTPSGESQSGSGLKLSGVFALFAVFLYVFWPQPKPDKPDTFPYQPHLPAATPKVPSIEQSVLVPTIAPAPSADGERARSDTANELMDSLRWKKIDHWGQTINMKPAGNTTDQAWDAQVLKAQSWEAVADNNSGLVWAVGALEGKHTFLEANALLEGLVWAGYTDWRLPSPKELLSLRDAGGYIEFTQYFPLFEKVTDPAYFWIRDSRPAKEVNESVNELSSSSSYDRHYQEAMASVNEVLNKGGAFNFMDGSYQQGGSHYVLFVRGRRL